MAGAVVTGCPFLAEVANINAQIEAEAQHTPCAVRPGDHVVWRCGCGDCMFKIVEPVREYDVVDLSHDWPQDLIHHVAFQHRHVERYVLRAYVPA